MTPCCSLCGALRPANRLAPYFVGDVRRHACEAEACRRLARAEMRGEVAIETREAA